MSSAFDDPITRVIALLNDALERDPEAITKMFNARVECNEALMSHPTIRIGVYDDAYKLGVLGLLNGVLGKAGAIGAEGEVDVQSKRFLRIRRFIDTRDGIDFSV